MPLAGDMPIVLTADGPSLGGFVCPVTTIEADMWKWGQVRPGDLVHMELVTLPVALAARAEMGARIAALETAAESGSLIDTEAVRSPLTAPVCGPCGVKRRLQLAACAVWAEDSQGR